jgi:hypothetical protein
VTLSLKEWPPLRASLDAGKPIILCQDDARVFRHRGAARSRKAEVGLTRAILLDARFPEALDTP